jgi:glycyl-tRNA synthetase
MVLAMMSYAYQNEKLEDGSERVVMKLPPALAPVKVAVLPLVKKDGLPEKALEIFNALKFSIYCQYDDKDSIGRRYRRQDAIGTPYCITIDHDTLQNGTVTIRERDSMKQERIAVSEVSTIVEDRVSFKNLLTS